MVPPWGNSEGICCVARHYKAIDQVILSCRCRARRVRRLRWGHNGNKVPSTLWRMDLYDNLKPYSTAIGCYSGGFNCYVVWMEAYRTNSDLELIEHRRSPRCCTCCWRQLESCPFISTHSRGKPLVLGILINFSLHNGGRLFQACVLLFCFVFFTKS